MSETNELFKVVYSPEAQEDVRSIYMYIAFELLAEQAAGNQINHIQKKIHSLDTLPKRYEKVEWEPWSSMGMRKVSVGNYVIFYLVDDNNRLVIINRFFIVAEIFKECFKKQ